MQFQTWLLYVMTVFVVSATPGPNMLLVMTHGIHHGFRRSLATCLGCLFALSIIMGVSAAGLGALLTTSELLFGLVKYVGAAYLVYIGIKTWRAVPRPVVESNVVDGVTHSPWKLFRSGFLVAMSNPKAILFFTALFPQFIDASLPQAPQLAILAATFFVIEAGWQFVYSAGGARLAGWLKSASRLRMMNRISGGAFVGAGALLTGIHRQ